MQDDYKNYQNIDRNLKNIGMSDPDRQVIFCFYFHQGQGFVILFKKKCQNCRFLSKFLTFDLQKFLMSKNLQKVELLEFFLILCFFSYQAVYTTIASVLHLGNIEFEDDPDDNRGGSRITEKAEKSLQITAGLMGLDSDELR